MSSQTGNSTPRAGALIALLGLSSLITGLDFTIVYVALPEIASDLGFSSHNLQWVISAYAISFGGLLLLAGRAGDLYGHRRIFLAGMALFTIGSVLGALSATPGLLIAARVIQGTGAAALFPSTLALVTKSFAEGRQRNRALGAWAAAGAVGLSLGALSGGVLTELTGWQGVFWVNVPLTLLCVVGVAWLIPADASRAAGSALDLPGALTGTIGLTLLVFTVVRGPELGWTTPRVLLTGVSAVLLIACFMAIEAKTSRPLLPLTLFRNPNLRVVAIVIFLFGMTLNSVPYILTQYFQSVLDFTALEAGLAFLLPTASITVGNLLGDKLIAFVGTGNVLLCGLLIGGAGSFVVALVMGSDRGLLAASPGIAAFGLGLGLVYPAMFSAAGTGVHESETGIASGFASTALQLGTAVGLAVLVAVSSTNTTGPAQVSAGLQNGLQFVAAGALVAALTAIALPKGEQPPASRKEAPRTEGTTSAT